MHLNCVCKPNRCFLFWFLGVTFFLRLCKVWPLYVNRVCLVAVCLRREKFIWRFLYTYNILGQWTHFIFEIGWNLNLTVKEIGKEGEIGENSYRGPTLFYRIFYPYIYTINSVLYYFIYIIFFLTAQLQFLYKYQLFLQAKEKGWHMLSSNNICCRKHLRFSKQFK